MSTVQLMFERTLIFSLLARRTPVAVFLAIAAFIVATVKGKARGWLAHICEEIVKLKPARIFDGDASATVVSPRARIGIGATLDHVSPTHIDGRGLSPPRVTVRGSIPVVLRPPATARFGVTAAEMDHLHHSFITTLASAASLGFLSARRRNEFKHGQRIERLPDHGGQYGNNS